MYPINKEEQRLLNEVNETYLPKRIAMGIGAVTLAVVAGLFGLGQLEKDSAQEEVRHISCRFAMEMDGTYHPDFDTTATLRPDQKVEKGVAQCDQELSDGEYLVDINGQGSCKILERRVEDVGRADTVYPLDSFLILADCRPLENGE